MILVTNTVSARQWRDELIRRTTPDRGGDRRVLRGQEGDPAGHHRDLPGDHHQARRACTRTWSCSGPATGVWCIYDEVHLLPAPVFRMTADLQARRRLGLTATLVREDGREGDVFSLIGPKRFDAPWKDIEAQGYIAPADCIEVRVTPDRGRADDVRGRRAGREVPAGLDRGVQDRRGRRPGPQAPRAPRRW